MISLIVVNYRTAALAADAVRSARTATSAPLQVVIVDNSCDPAEAERLRPLADVLLVAERNRGYAGGVNLGRTACDAPVIVLSNPDVHFDAGSIDRLSGELQGRTAVAGPALFWDAAHEWRLPPGDLGTAGEKLDAILASRSHAWFAERDRRRFRQRVKFWSLDRTTPVRMLSGAVLAVRTKEFDRAGGFDERFPLYFEEADFLRRIASLHRRIVFVPDARCRHLYNQSASQIAVDAAKRYAISELRYLEKWNGPWAARTLKRLERPLPPFTMRKLERETPTRRRCVIEASPLPSFATAAGRFGDDPDDLSLPSDVLASARGSTLYVRSVDRETGEVLATSRISA